MRTTINHNIYYREQWEKAMDAIIQEVIDSTGKIGFTGRKATICNKLGSDGKRYYEVDGSYGLGDDNYLEIHIECNKKWMDFTISFTPNFCKDADSINVDCDYVGSWGKDIRYYLNKYIAIAKQYDVGICNFNDCMTVCKNKDNVLELVFSGYFGVYTREE